MAKYERWYGRVNTGQAFKAWADGRSCKPAQSVWSDGDTIWSYQTAILTRDGDRVILNRTTYSITTTTHQNALRTALKLNGIEFVEVDGMSRGVGPERLKKRARHSWFVPGETYPKQNAGEGSVTL